jgi:intracellular multiplication protein IcmD
MSQHINYREIVKGAICLVLAVSCFYATHAFAQEGLGGVAKSVSESLKAVSGLLGAVSFVAGLGFAIAGILKFKAYKDKAGQIPLSTPIIMMFVAVALLFLPTIINKASQTLFGGEGGEKVGFEETFELK